LFQLAVVCVTDASVASLVTGFSATFQVICRGAMHCAPTILHRVSPSKT
jgi:hypothetical protein